MIKLLIGRVMPLAGAGWLVTSSVSPIRPALNAFATAADALAGSSTEDSGVVIPDHVDPNMIPGSGASGGGSWWDRLFGKSNKAVAKDQLDDVIKRVKEQGTSHVEDSASPPDRKGSGGKRGKGKR